MFYATLRLTHIPRFRLVGRIDGFLMNRTVVESSAKAILDLNEKVRVLHVDDDSGFLKISKNA